MRIGYSDDFGGVNGRQIGQVNETASIAYTGELLPAGTAVYSGISIDSTKRYLKNSGKDKTPALVESGQGKFFNGTSQYINTGITPNQAEGTLVTRFTYVTGMVSRCIIGTSEISIWVNASGKIEGLFGNAVITSNDVLVNGKSYHVELPYLGLNASIIVDNVTKASGTASSFTPTLPLFIGARNNSGTADRYFNNVIDETYYYDVALTDAQIESLYKYPEKVKAYNVAIVPDIGSEANCKLFLPLCENSGSNVVNVAVAMGSELVVNGGFESDTSWTKGTGWTISGGTLNANVTNGSYALADQAVSISNSKAYLITFDITAYTSGAVRMGLYGGTAQLSGTNRSDIGSYSEILINNSTGNNRFLFVANSAGNFVGSIDNVSVKEITAYPLVNYTTAMHTSAAKLSYGAQCTAWKRNSLGMLLGMSNGLSFDGGVRVKQVTTAYSPTLTDNFAVAVTLAKNNNIQRDTGAIGTVLFRKTTTNTVVPYVFSQTATASVSQTEDYARYAIKYDGTTKLFTFYKNGVLVSASSVVASVVGSAISFGQTDLGAEAYYRIYKPSQIAKFDPVKDYQASLKYVAKLGA